MPAQPVRRIALVLVLSAAVATGAGLTASASAAGMPHVADSRSATVAEPSPSDRAASMHEVARMHSSRCGLTVVVRVGGTDVDPRVALVVKADNASKPSDTASKPLRYYYGDGLQTTSGKIQRGGRTLLPFYGGSIRLGVSDGPSYYDHCTSLFWNVTEQDRYIDVDGRLRIPRKATLGKPFRFANYTPPPEGTGQAVSAA